MNFSEFCILHRVTKSERDWLAWNLAMWRAKLLYELFR